MENLAKRNNVTFDGNQQNIDLRVSKLCVVLYYYGTICVFFLYGIRMYGKSFSINLTKCVQMLFSNLFE